MNSEHTNEQAKKFEQEKTELIKKHHSEIQFLGRNRDSQFRSLEEELKKSYETQVERIQRNYNESLTRHSDQLRVLENQLKSSFEEQLRNKDSTIKTLQHEKEEYKKKASEDAKTAAQHQLDKLQNEILQRDIQLLRFKDEVATKKTSNSDSG